MRSAVVTCSKCAARVCEFLSLGAGEGGGLLTDRSRLLRTGWFGGCEQPATAEQAELLLARIERGELASLVAEDPDLFAFFCKKCGRAYCSDCWRVDPPTYDDGFYDSTRGSCPEGHEKTLDD